MKNKNYEKYFEEIRPILILIVVMFLVYDAMGFWKQMHVVDSVHNFHKMESFVNSLTNKTIQLQDMNSDYVIRDIDVSYIAAMNSLEKNYIQTVALSILLGMLIRRKNGKNN